MTLRSGRPDMAVTVGTRCAAEYLPYDDLSRADVQVAIAFLSRAAVEPALAAASSQPSTASSTH